MQRDDLRNTDEGELDFHELVVSLFWKGEIFEGL
jgi:hypothetical protein